MQTLRIFVIGAVAELVKLSGNKTDKLHTLAPVVLLLTVPTRYPCCSSSLFVCLWFQLCQLDKASSFDTEPPFLDLNLCIYLMAQVPPNFTINGTIFIRYRQFHFLDGDVPRCTSYGVYISQLIKFARASSK